MREVPRTFDSERRTKSKRHFFSGLLRCLFCLWRALEGIRPVWVFIMAFAQRLALFLGRTNWFFIFFFLGWVFEAFCFVLVSRKESGWKRVGNVSSWHYSRK